MLLPLLLAIPLALGLFHHGRTWLGWALPGALLFVGWAIGGVASPGLFFALLGAFALAAAVGGYRPLRCALLTRPLLPRIARILPRMSDTERTAIEAGTVFYETEFFAGKPDWQRLHGFRSQPLSEREQAFLDGPVEEVCAMVDDYEVNRAGDLPDEVWDFVKRKGFMGMIIPESYGGLGFSAAGHSAVVTKLSSRSVALAVTVMVPNSLGPAELLLHYGTDEQKDHYLPRLAGGEEVPAFALTEPGAGSDAGAMTSSGVVCEGTWKGKRTLGIRLNWDKRYITLSPVATVLGLAFKLRDPEHLLGYAEDLGITCALVPTDLPGVEVGRRHDPLGVAFMNGPTSGEDVFVPIDSIIGGREMAGKGWMMLMQSLAAGRGISLPSMACGAAKLAVRATGAYASVRRQFKIPIGSFEGIQDRLARIAGLSYAMDAARDLTVGAVDAGEKPSVASAIVKCYLSEGMREITNHAMDVVGGAGICRGPRNVLAEGYAALPIGITVEGANILTRSMIIFGQGAIRCHPFVQREMRAAEQRDVAGFDEAFFGHVGFVFQNMARTLVHGLSAGATAESPVGNETAVYYRRLTRLSAAFAFASDLAMGTLGGALKRRESITGRFADVLAHLYMASASLRRFHAEGSRPQDLAIVSWVCEDSIFHAQEALRGIARNLPLRPAGWLLGALAFPLGARYRPPTDRLAHKVAAGLLEGRAPREELSRGMYVPPKGEHGLGLLETALDLAVRSAAVERKLKEAVRKKRLVREPRDTFHDRAVEAEVISDAERALLAEAEEARSEAIAVDSFEARRYAEMTA